jgi:peptide/nickel transport system substrate-binding protein
LKRYRIKAIISLVLILLILLSVVACNGSNTSTTPATSSPNMSTTTSSATVTTTTTSTSAVTQHPERYGGTFRVIDNRLPESSVGYPPKLLGQDIDYVLPTVETLIRCDSELNPLPWLASDWEIAADKSNIVFSLRQGIKFHDGTDFNAQAVKFNLDGAIAANLGGTTSWVGVDVINDYTVRLNLSRWENMIFDTLATFPGMMVSPTSIQTNGEEWAATHAVGTGPFTLETFRRGEIMQYKRNPNYWIEGLPYLEAIEYICIPDTVAEVVAFRADEADAVNAWSAQCISDLKQVPDTVFSYRPDGVWILYPDDANPDSPFSKLKVRQALNACIDKDALAKATGYGIFEAAKVISIPDTIGYDSNLTPSEYDVDKAKQLMTEAGYPNGFECTLIITIPAPDVKDAQVAIAGFLSKIGIDCTLEYADAAKYAEYMQKGWHNAIIYAPGAGDNILRAMRMYYDTAGYYVSLKGPDGLVDMINAALATSTVEPALVNKIAKAMNDEVSMVPITYMGTAWVYKNYVNDLGRLDFSSFRVIAWEQIWLSNLK